MANIVRGKSSSEIREMFDISRDPPNEETNPIENTTENIISN